MSNVSKRTNQMLVGTPLKWIGRWGVSLGVVELVSTTGLELIHVLDDATSYQYQGIEILTASGLLRLLGSKLLGNFSWREKKRKT